MHNIYTRMTAVLSVALLGFALGACEEKGPVEQFGEEVDEAVDTAKSGQESTTNKLDDAADELREGTQDAADEVKSK